MIDVEKNSLLRSSSDCSSLFLEMDKYMKTRFKYLLKNKTGPKSADGGATFIDSNAIIDEMQKNKNELHNMKSRLYLMIGVSRSNDAA